MVVVFQIVKRDISSESPTTSGSATTRSAMRHAEPSLADRATFAVCARLDETQFQVLLFDDLRRERHIDAARTEHRLDFPTPNGCNC